MARRPKAASTPVEVEVRFVRPRHNGSAICVHDGRETVSQWTGRMVPLETWIPMKLINNAADVDLDGIRPRQLLNLSIPEWFAMETGLI